MPEIAGHYFKEVRKGWTRVEFTDGESLELRREVFSEFGFGNGLTVTAEELQQALRQSHLRHGRAVALRFLRERPRSTLEIDRRLRRDDLPADAIASVLEDLTRQGHLNDADFARAWITSRVDMRPKGMFLIRRELSEKGIDEAVIDAALERAHLLDQVRHATSERLLLQIRGVVCSREARVEHVRWHILGDTRLGGDGRVGADAQVAGRPGLARQRDVVFEFRAATETH